MQCRIKYNIGFTLVEILIASSVLSLFLIGLFSLYSGGQKIGGQTLWVQRTINSLRFASRHIVQNVKKSSYPSTIIYPGKVIENKKDDFKLRYRDTPVTYATQTVSVTAPKTLGTYILAFTESIPEKQQSDSNASAIINYHIYSLCKEGKLCYAEFSETGINTTGPDYIKALSRPTIPPAGASRIKFSTLVNDVESVKIFSNKPNAVSPITFSITCRYPRGNTRRTEKAVAVPNVANLAHAAGSGGW